jgi:hypothetical protein
MFLATFSQTQLTCIALSLWETKFHTHVKQRDVFSFTINHHHLHHSCLIKLGKQMCLYFIRPLKTNPGLKWCGLLEYNKTYAREAPCLNLGRSTGMELRVFSHPPIVMSVKYLEMRPHPIVHILLRFAINNSVIPFWGEACGIFVLFR